MSVLVGATFVTSLLLTAPGPEPVAGEPSEASERDTSESDPQSVDASSEDMVTEPGGTMLPKKEWMLIVAPGFEYVDLGLARALGGGLRLGGHAILWGGKRGNFLIGGGPVLQYTFLRDPEFDDSLHLATLNAEMIIGGGMQQRWAVYGHLLTGLGYARVIDASGLTINTVGIRAAAGVGAFGKINKRFSLGALVDVGWAAGVWVNAMVTANIHFGRRGQKL